MAWSARHRKPQRCGARSAAVPCWWSRESGRRDRPRAISGERERRPKRSAPAPAFSWSGAPCVMRRIPPRQRTRSRERFSPRRCRRRRHCAYAFSARSREGGNTLEACTSTATVLPAVAILLVDQPTFRLRLLRGGALFARKVGEELLRGRVRARGVDAAPRASELHIPGDAVVLRPLLQLLDGEEGVGIRHRGVVLRIHLAKLARIRLVLPQVQARLAEEVLVLAVADGT